METVDTKWRNKLRELELERIDPTWRQPVQEQQVVVVKRATPIDEATKRLYFNAGRYAAGARDTIATKAHAKLQKQGEA
jgi:hypothetical protein